MYGGVLVQLPFGFQFRDLRSGDGSGVHGFFLSWESGNPGQQLTLFNQRCPFVGIPSAVLCLGTWQTTQNNDNMLVLSRDET
ncbi:hypothetical protein WICPIJ_009866 [Wickerhamomyces pijperi]|uniref:Uncharacterized protein n=1 Tax=Wickerhamomyces pijperi TaxID=599730 RepID=A0A9P8PJJ2_WICPI|nr:hypothetical protein WICPIJ_009866 [Wickerhamomyces pijperi]